MHRLTTVVRLMRWKARLHTAYDLAIAARNVLAVPELAAMAATPEYRFDGPDGPHVEC